ncbi:hypothetical protein [uncultured Salinicola sp.]|uniref:hypothetical protein n=1 Tax=uncultured Salinicola sp. TaxID=1193542 RepID=UPI002618FF99|nr:hypothetical protein [uncultured Salinicola sp.]|tara:strand:- start:6735 stop:7193 length:459 start_codon:yes stop_codon:yes gene_type:complete
MPDMMNLEEEMGERGKCVLVVVHPASACGSADFSMGDIEAAEARYALGRTIHQWKGPAVVFDNEFNDELATYGQIGLAISGLEDVRRSHACASDPMWIDIARQAIGATDGDHFLLTGAWHHPDDRSGCIDAISCMLDEDRKTWEIMPCAFRI